MTDGDWDDSSAPRLRHAARQRRGERRSQRLLVLFNAGPSRSSSRWRRIFRAKTWVQLFDTTRSPRPRARKSRATLEAGATFQLDQRSLVVFQLAGELEEPRDAATGTPCPSAPRSIDGGVRFALWAPTADEVRLVVDGADHAMPDAGEGWRRPGRPGRSSRRPLRVPHRRRARSCPDPASRFQPDDVTAEPSSTRTPSPGATADWRGRPWEEAVLYEVHVGTATPEGTYRGAGGEARRTSRDLGVTAIELMPIADFPGSRNWGYDGVLPYAPDAAYGTPDDLKRLVDRAHALGLMVFLDVVYNHFGPAGNYLHAYAKTFFTERHQTPWGAGINFDGRAGAARARLLHRQRAVLARGIPLRRAALRRRPRHPRRQRRPHIIAELAERVASRASRTATIHLVLENEANEARWLERDAAGRPGSTRAQWNDDIHHCWHVLLTGEDDGYYARLRRQAGRTPRPLPRGGLRLPGRRPRRIDGRARGEPSAHLPPIGLRHLPAEPRPGRQPRARRAADRAADPEQLALAPGRACCSRRRSRCSSWARNGRPRRRSCSSSISRTTPSCPRRCATDGGASSASFPPSPTATIEIPDPTARGDLPRSKLDWTEARRAPHAAILAETRTLLALRQRRDRAAHESGFLGASHAHADARRARRALALRRRHAALRRQSRRRRRRRSTRSPRERVIWRSRRCPSMTASDRALPSWTGLFARIAGMSGRRSTGRPAVRRHRRRLHRRLRRHRVGTLRDQARHAGAASASPATALARSPRASPSIAALRGAPAAVAAHAVEAGAARRSSRSAAIGGHAGAFDLSTRTAASARAASAPRAQLLDLPALTPGYHRSRLNGDARATTDHHRGARALLAARDPAPAGGRALGPRGAALRPALGGQSRHRRLRRRGRRPRATPASRRLVPRPQPGPRPVRGRPHQDLALFAVLAPVPRDAAHRSDRARRVSRKRRRAPARRAGSRRASRPCARPPSSIMPAIWAVNCARCSTRSGRTFAAGGRTPRFAAFRASEAGAARSRMPRSRRCPSISGREGRIWLGDWPEPYRTRRLRRGRGLRAPSMPTRSPSTPGCNGSPTASSRGAAQARAHGRHVDRPLPRSRGRRRSRRLGDLVRARALRRDALDRRAARSPRARRARIGACRPSIPLTLERDGLARLPRAGAGQHAPCRRDPHRPRLPARSASS